MLALVSSQLDSIYSDTPGYLGSEVIGFSSGSIKVEYVLLFEEAIDGGTVASMLNESITPSTGEITTDTSIIVKTSTVTTVQGVFNNHFVFITSCYYRA